MKLVSQNTTLNAANPVLWFAWHEGGRLEDLDSLNFAIYRISNDTELATPVVVVAPTSVNLNSVVDGGDRIGIGRYAARWTVGTATPGRHEIRWTYFPPGSTVAYEAREVFDVVTSVGPFYIGPFYCGLSDLRDEGFTTGDLSDIRAVQKIQAASRFIDRVTGRFFEPRYLVQPFNGSGRPLLLLDQPIIAIEDLEILAGTISGTIYMKPEDVTIYKVYNRHIAGMLSPDDRDNPKIEFYRSEERAGYHFPMGQQNVILSGVFGYTDPCGWPLGVQPEQIKQVCMLLVARDMVKLGDRDAREDARWRGRLTSEHTRDQGYTIGKPGDLGLIANITGDPDIDGILAAYIRPPQIGGV